MESTGTTSESPPESTTVENDAGLRPWLVLIGGILATTVSAGYSSAFGVYEDIYTRFHTSSASNVGWIGSTQIFLIFAVGLPAGKLLDKGYFRQTVLAGSLIFLVSLFSLSLAHPTKYYQLWLSQGLGMGLGAGLIYAPSVVIQGHHWGRRKSFAMAMIALGNSTGGVIFPIMLNRLFHGSAGFAQGVRASAFLCLGLLVVSNLLMKDNSASKQRVQKAAGRDTLTDLPFLVFTFGLLCLTCALFFPFFYLELFATNHGIQPQVAIYLLAIFNAAGIVGRIAAGFLAHHFGPFNVIIVALFCATGLIFSLLGVKTAASSIIFAVLYGMTSGIVLSLPGACTAVISSRVPDQIGLRFGIACFITAFGALGTGPINGSLLGPNFIWWKPIAFSGVMSALGLVCLVLVLWILCTNKDQELD